MRTGVSYGKNKCLRTHFYSDFRAKVALLALLSEKADADQRYKDNASAADQARSSLGEKLRTTAAALRVAEERVRTLELDLIDDNNEKRKHDEGCTKASSASSACAVLAIDRARAPFDRNNRESSPLLPAIPEEETCRLREATDVATGTQLEAAKAPPASLACVTLAIDHGRAAARNRESSPLAAIPEEEACQLRDPTDEEGMGTLVDASKVEVESLRADLYRAREAERVAIDAAMKERGAAERRAAELMRAIEHVERESEQARTLADGRLEKLGQALEQEEQESGVSVRQARVLTLPAASCDRFHVSDRSSIPTR